MPRVLPMTLMTRWSQAPVPAAALLTLHDLLPPQPHWNPDPHTPPPEVFRNSPQEVTQVVTTTTRCRPKAAPMPQAGLAWGAGRPCRHSAPLRLSSCLLPQGEVSVGTLSPSPIPRECWALELGRKGGVTGSDYARRAIIARTINGN